MTQCHPVHMSWQGYNPNLDRRTLNPRGVASLMAAAAPQGQGTNPQITLILPTSNDGNLFLYRGQGTLNLGVLQQLTAAHWPMAPMQADTGQHRA
jgi:hypothetical protein